MNKIFGSIISVIVAETFLYILSYDLTDIAFMFLCNMMISYIIHM